MAAAIVVSCSSQPQTNSGADNADVGRDGDGATRDVGPDARNAADAARDTTTSEDTADADVWPPPGPWRSRLFPPNWTPRHTHPDGWYLHDFSYAGYHHSEADIGVPAEPAIYNVVDHGADNTGATDASAAIQQTIDQASASGGVVYLPEGLYRVDAALSLQASNVVIRGDGPARTRLHFTASQGRSHQSHLTVGRGVSHQGEWPLVADADSRTRELHVDDASGLTVGQDIAVGWVITPEFVADHAMGDHWQAFNDQWQPFFRREIVAIDTATEPDTVTLDVPLRYPTLVRDQASIRGEDGAIREVGIESLAVGDATDWQAAWSEDQIHVIEFRGVEDAWIRDVASFQPPSVPSSGPGSNSHLQSGGILVRDSKRMTVADSILENAQNRGSGGNGYLFEVRASSEILFRDCLGRAGRHNFIQNWGFGATGIVWLRVRSEGGKALTGSDSGFASTGASEFHHSLAMANLIDSSIAEDGWKAVNRKDYSSGAGHTATGSVFWNVGGTGRVDSYQYGRGYVIGSAPELTVKTKPLNLDLGPLNSWTDTEPYDWTEGRGRSADLEPQSLFEAQLARRLAP